MKTNEKVITKQEFKACMQNVISRNTIVPNEILENMHQQWIKNHDSKRYLNMVEISEMYNAAKYELNKK